MDTLVAKTPLEKYVLTLEEEQGKLLEYIRKVENDFNNKLAVLQEERETECMILEFLIMRNNMTWTYSYATINRLNENQIKVFKRFGWVYLLYDVKNERHVIAFHPDHRQALINLEPQALIALKRQGYYANYEGPFEFVQC